MTKHLRECLDICQRAGLNTLGIESRGKHVAIRCVEGTVFCATTPSDHRSQKNLRALARRIARTACG